jgi:hypothetical protein
MNIWMHEQMDRQGDEWDGWMDGWMDGRTDRDRWIMGGKTGGRKERNEEDTTAEQG